MKKIRADIVKESGLLAENVVLLKFSRNIKINSLLESQSFNLIFIDLFIIEL